MGALKSEIAKLRALTAAAGMSATIKVQHGEVTPAAGQRMDPKLLHAFESALQVLERPHSYVGSAQTFEAEWLKQESKHMDRIASPRRVDQARNPSSRPRSPRSGSGPSIPGSFLTRPRRIMEDAFEGWEAPDFGSPLRTARKVNPKFVSCNPPSAAIEAITGPDPAGVIQAANTRAIALLDYVIRDLQDKRDQIRSGATTTDVVEDLPTRELLRTRFHMNADEIPSVPQPARAASSP